MNTILMVERLGEGTARVVVGEDACRPARDGPATDGTEWPDVTRRDARAFVSAASTRCVAT